ncbi:MAG: flagellar biosynthesis protein FlhA [Betaproteobacteria bacterium]
MAEQSLAIGRLMRGMDVRALSAPVLIILILAMMVLPLPPFLLDVLFTFNIAVAVMVLMGSLYARHALEFSSFPTVLLVTTLLRLSLNVASTRVVLLEGHTGPDAAGRVIEAFGHFLVGGNYAVGLIVFVILVVINFVVVTKGAGRIAEVAARFTLDAMPGKQMAIDADLNAGLIGEEAARSRRKQIGDEADFYGSMDGASKFVRGDAVAGILILLLNIIGGLIVGVGQHDMAFADAAKNYTLLTIGDGLVAQIPALVISIAAGIVVSRVGSGEDLSEQVMSQVFGDSRVLFLAGGVVGVLGLIPGMPNLVFLALAAGLVWLGQWRRARQAAAAEEPAPAAASPEPGEAQEASWADVTPVDVLGLEVGYRLIGMVDKTQDGELLRRIRGLRRKFAQEIGFLCAPVHIRDNLELRPNGYRILLKGVVVGEGEAWPGQWLAINPGRVGGTLPGQDTHDPAFGLPAVWVDGGLREQAHALGYTVVDASTVIATHLNQLLLTHAAELLGREECQALLDHLGRDAPRLVEDLVPKQMALSVVQRVLQNLLSEGVPLRDMRSIVETLAEQATRTQEPMELTGRVRAALGRAIVQQLAPGQGELPVMVLDPQLERLLGQTLQAGQTDAVGIEPGLAETLLTEAAQAVREHEELGLSAILLVPERIRWLLSRFLRRSVPALHVLSHNEVPENRNLKVTIVIGGKS